MTTSIPWQYSYTAHNTNLNLVVLPSTHMVPMNTFLGRLAVTFVLFLILFPVLTSQIFIVWPWYGRRWTVELVYLLLPFNVVSVMLLWNYYLCIFTDPGGVPDGWEPDIGSDEGYEVKKHNGGPRYCRTCERYKPPRSHHCRQCNRCILRMDHHCPWVNNCIGYFNHGHFIRFLFYVDMCCSYHLAMVTRRVFAFSGRYYFNEPSATELFFVIMNYVTVGPVLLTVGVFSLYHFHGLLANTTTIEGWEKDKAATLVRHGNIHEVKYPYDLGVWRNITSVLGKNPLKWCCPSTPQGQGLKYQLSSGDSVESQHSWPPRAPGTEKMPFKLPDSPWTYGNGNVNPDLRPSSSNTPKFYSRQAYTSALPPYHPDFEENSSPRPPQYLSSDLDTDLEGHGGVKLRHGSESYEVRPLDREEMLRRYIETQVSEEGRYQVYEPDPLSDHEYDFDSLAPSMSNERMDHYTLKTS
ncbi:DHHC palmitoyltransferase-domain-containing protein [Pisolithus croceorrhizus]|nr:DHHC palmitoyltransferase-domain-containing protein [Pisolithus croceorrhizus]